MVGGQIHLGLVQDVEILHPHVILLIEETLPLYPGHVEQIQLRQGVLQADNLLEILMVGPQHIVPDVAGHPQLLRGDEDELYILVAHQGLDQGVNGAAEFQISAQTDSQVIEPSL